MPWKFWIVLLSCLSFGWMIGCGTEANKRTVEGENNDGRNNGDGGGGERCLTCADVGGVCGRLDDGCGGTIDCACSCTPDDFMEACPQRPCEEVRGCVDNKCIYEQFRCGGIECRPEACEGEGCEQLCTGPGCSDDALRACGGLECNRARYYCQATPVGEERGHTIYANSCVDGASQGCGACNLGQETCERETKQITCDIPMIFEGGGGAVDCDSSSSRSTFIYVDADFDDVNSWANGSQNFPFTSYDDALKEAVKRSGQGARQQGIVIAGSPTFTTPLVIGNGVSVLGGYARESFRRDLQQRPSWVISEEHYDAENNRLYGALADGITLETTLRGIRILTDGIAGRNVNKVGGVNVGLLVVRSVELILEDVQIYAGAGGDGVRGEDGGALDSDWEIMAAKGQEPGVVSEQCRDEVGECVVENAPFEFKADGSRSATDLQGQGRCGFGGGGPQAGVLVSGALVSNAGNNGHAAGAAVDTRAAGGAGGKNGELVLCKLAALPGTGMDGKDAFPAGDGTNGSLARFGGFSETGAWKGTAGGDGESGKIGSWGGGGGASGGQYGEESGSRCLLTTYAASGGGGGAPGCGGRPGRGGGSGGPSLAVAVINVSDDTMGQVAPGKLSIHRSQLYSGKGGNGGSGGMGNVGMIGGAGFKADLSQDALGGKGGNGSQGGKGGWGAGGHGGDSTAIYCANAGYALLDGMSSLVTPHDGGGIMGPGGYTDHFLGGENGSTEVTRGCN